MKDTKFKSIHDPCPYGNDDCPKCGKRGEVTAMIDKPGGVPEETTTEEKLKEWDKMKKWYDEEMDKQAKMTKTEQIREELWVDVMEDYVFLLKMTPYAKDEAKNMDECRKQLDKIVAWVEQKLAEQREDYKKILNSGRKMYQQGREDEKKEIIDWCKKRCQDNIRINGTDKWNGDMEDLIEVLKK